MNSVCYSYESIFKNYWLSIGKRVKGDFIQVVEWVLWSLLLFFFLTDCFIFGVGHCRFSRFAVNEDFSKRFNKHTHQSCIVDYSPVCKPVAIQWLQCLDSQNSPSNQSCSHYCYYNHYNHCSNNCCIDTVNCIHYSHCSYCNRHSYCIDYIQDSLSYCNYCMNLNSPDNQSYSVDDCKCIHRFRKLCYTRDWYIHRIPDFHIPNRSHSFRHIPDYHNHNCMDC